MTCSHLFNEAGRISHKMWVIQRQIFVCVINIPAKLLGKCQFDNHSCSHEQKRPVHGIETVTRLCRCHEVNKRSLGLEVRILY